MYGRPYYTGDTSIVEPALILFVYLFALILILVLFKWQLSGPMGVLLLVLQARRRRHRPPPPAAAPGRHVVPRTCWPCPLHPSNPPTLQPSNPPTAAQLHP